LDPCDEHPVPSLLERPTTDPLERADMVALVELENRRHLIGRTFV
jgi:hypothetical protein